MFIVADLVSLNSYISAVLGHILRGCNTDTKYIIANTCADFILEKEKFPGHANLLHVLWRLSY